MVSTAVNVSHTKSPDKKKLGFETRHKKESELVPKPRSMRLDSEKRVHTAKSIILQFPAWKLRAESLITQLLDGRLRAGRFRLQYLNKMV